MLKWQNGLLKVLQTPQLPCSDIPFPRRCCTPVPSTLLGAHLLLRTACEVAILTSRLQIRDLSKSQVYRLQSLCYLLCIRAHLIPFPLFSQPHSQAGPFMRSGTPKAKFSQANMTVLRRFKQMASFSGYQRHDDMRLSCPDLELGCKML